MSRFHSESFIPGSSFFRGQVIGAENREDIPMSHIYLNHDDIYKQSSQLFHTETSSKRPWWFFPVIHPMDQSRRLFDFATVLWVLALMFFVPVDIGFDWFDTPSWQKMSYAILDFWFTLDIILNFRTGFISHGTVVMDPKKITSNYLTTWFFVDAIGTFPFERLIRGESASRKSLKLTKYFKIPKLLRITRVLKYVRNHTYVYDFSKVIILIFTLLHMGACLWVVIIDPCEEGSSNYSGDEVCAQENAYRLYAEALHLSAVMILGVSNVHMIGKSELFNLDFTGRKEDRTKIYFVGTLYMVVGLFLVALLMSEVNVYVMGKMQGSAAFQSKTDRVNHEMEYYGVPYELQVQVHAYHDYVWIHQKQYDDKIALLSDQQMSTHLQRKLALHLFKDVVSHISFFSGIDDFLLGEICMSLRTRIFLPRDMIIFKGDVGKEVFIISKGVVEVIRDDLPANMRRNSPQILLKNGSFFGEISLVMEVRRTCSVQARTVCEINVLQQAAFDAVLRENPPFARRMNELVVARQLDSSLARSHHQGVDFRVSRSDLDRAVAVMGKKMKETLNKRMARDSPAIIDSNHGATFHRSPVRKNPIVKVSFEDESRDFGKRRRPAQKPFPKLDKSHVGVEKYTSTESETNDDELDLSIRSSSAELPMSDVIRDITRRSTRFVYEGFFKKLRKRSDRPSFDGADNISVTGALDTCSDTEFERSKEYHEVSKRLSLSGINVTDGDLDTNLEGHFRPGKGTVDLSKVRPLILNPQTESQHEDDVQSLNEQIHHQGRMMENLISKIEHLEHRAKDALCRNHSVEENDRHDVVSK